MVEKLIPVFPGKLIGLKESRSIFEKYITDFLRTGRSFLLGLVGLPKTGKTHFLTYYYWKINEGKFGRNIALYSPTVLNVRDMGENFIAGCKSVVVNFNLISEESWPQILPSETYDQLYRNITLILEYLNKHKIKNVFWLIDDFNVIYSYIGWKSRIFISRFNELLNMLLSSNVSVVIASTPGTWNLIIEKSPIGSKINKVIRIKREV